jgi:hypothetical protein
MTNLLSSDYIPARRYFQQFDNQNKITPFWKQIQVYLSKLFSGWFLMIGAALLEDSPWRKALITNLHYFSPTT